jgi:hypothetical protein
LKKERIKKFMFVKSLPEQLQIFISGNVEKPADGEN